MKTAKQIRRFIDLELLDQVVDDDPISSGLLDSLAVEQLAAFVEDTYDIVLEDDDFVAENFTSIEAVAALVDRKVADKRATAGARR